MRCFVLSRWWGRQGYSRETLAQIVQYREGRWCEVPASVLTFTSLQSFLSFLLFTQDTLTTYNFSFLWPIFLSRKYITKFLLYFQRHLTRDFSRLVQFPELLSSNPVFYWRNWLCYRKMCKKIQLWVVQRYKILATTVLTVEAKVSDDK